MLPRQEAQVRRALALAETLRHEHLVRCMGTWEGDDAIYMGERGERRGRVLCVLCVVLLVCCARRALQRLTPPSLTHKPHHHDGLNAVEEYVGRGDVLNDAVRHPERYSERHVAAAIAGPLLRVLAYLHAANVVHRSVVVLCVLCAVV